MAFLLRKKHIRKLEKLNEEYSKINRRSNTYELTLIKSFYFSPKLHLLEDRSIEAKASVEAERKSK
jgi:hypothetical protein